MPFATRADGVETYAELEGARIIHRISAKLALLKSLDAEYAVVSDGVETYAELEGARIIH